MKFVISFFLALFVAELESSRILVLYPTLSQSHMLPLQALSVVLAERGHEVTFVSPFPLTKQVKNYRDIKIWFNETLKEELMPNFGKTSIRTMLTSFMSLIPFMNKISDDMLHSKEFQQIMNEEKFDLVIIGYLFNEYLLGVANHFYCPSVLFSTAGPLSIMSQALGNPLAVAGSQHALVRSVEMNFVGRLATFLATGVELSLTMIAKHFNRQRYE